MTSLVSYAADVFGIILFGKEGVDAGTCSFKNRCSRSLVLKIENSCGVSDKSHNSFVRGPVSLSVCRPVTSLPALTRAIHQLSVTTAIVIQGDSLARGLRLLSIKNMLLR